MKGKANCEYVPAECALCPEYEACSKRFQELKQQVKEDKVKVK